MQSSVQQKLVQLQQALYSATFNDAKLLETLNTPEVVGYSKNFERDLPATGDHIPQDTFLSELSTANMVLYGDFHTLAESQLGFVKLLQDFCLHQPQRSLVIAVEMFAANHQQHIDDFLEGKTDVKQFLADTNYDRHWGFQWERYGAVMNFAKTHSLKVKGINMPIRRGIRPTLKERDEFAAKVLLNMNKDFKNAVVFCMIGEHHLGDLHLPAELSRTFHQNATDLRCARVLNNHERYYFSPTTIVSSDSSYVRLKQNFFCILNTAPWIKWQSLHNWEESKRECLDEDADSDFQYYNEDGIDFDSQIVGYLKSLKEFLKLNIEDSELEDFHLFVAPGADTLAELKENYSLLEDDLSFIQDRLWRQEGCVLNYPAMIIDKDIALNYMAYAIGELLFTQLAKKHLGVRMIRTLGRDVSWLILRAVAGTIATKVFNPHWQPSLKNDPLLNGFKAESFLGNAMSLGLDTAVAFVKTVLQDKTHRDRLYAAKMFGERIGETLYKQVIENKMPANLFQKIFLSRLK